MNYRKRPDSRLMTPTSASDIRCMGYDDDGRARVDPNGVGCPLAHGLDCSFVHPDDDKWNFARRNPESPITGSHTPPFQPSNRFHSERNPNSPAPPQSIRATRMASSNTLSAPFGSRSDTSSQPRVPSRATMSNRAPSAESPLSVAAPQLPGPQLNTATAAHRQPEHLLNNSRTSAGSAGPGPVDHNAVGSTSDRHNAAQAVPSPDSSNTAPVGLSPTSNSSVPAGMMPVSKIPQIAPTPASNDLPQVVATSASNNMLQVEPTPDQRYLIWINRMKFLSQAMILHAKRVQLQSDYAARQRLLSSARCNDLPEKVRRDLKAGVADLAKRYEDKKTELNEMVRRPSTQGFGPLGSMPPTTSVELMQLKTEVLKLRDNMKKIEDSVQARIEHPPTASKALDAFPDHHPSPVKTQSNKRRRLSQDDYESITSIAEKPPRTARAAAVDAFDFPAQINDEVQTRFDSVMASPVNLSRDRVWEQVEKELYFLQDQLAKRAGEVADLNAKADDRRANLQRKQRENEELRGRLASMKQAHTQDVAALAVCQHELEALKRLMQQHLERFPDTYPRISMDMIILAMQHKMHLELHPLITDTNMNLETFIRACYHHSFTAVMALYSPSEYNLLS